VFDEEKKSNGTVIYIHSSVGNNELEVKYAK